MFERGDDIVLAGPSAALITAGTHIGPEIDGSEMLHDVTGEVLDVDGRCEGPARAHHPGSRRACG